MKKAIVGTGAILYTIGIVILAFGLIKYPSSLYEFSYAGLILASTGMVVLIIGLSFKKKALLIEKELEKKCTKCGERPATGQDGLCNHCRMDDILTQLAKRK